MISRSKSKVYFFSTDRSLHLRNRIGLKKFIELLLKKRGVKLEYLNYVFCSDSFLRNINRKYLSHNYNTDVITFNLSTSSNHIQGEVYISIDRIKKNASIFKCSITQELHRVLFHGVLHLLGYKDKTQKQSIEMRKMEDALLNEYFTAD